MQDVAIFEPERGDGSRITPAHRLLERRVLEQHQLLHSDVESLAELGLELVKGLVGPDFDSGASRLRVDPQDDLVAHIFFFAFFLI